MVTAIANLNDFRGKPLYSRKHPAKVILACDKALCPKTQDVTKFTVIYTLRNTGPLKKVAPPCPKKGVLGKGQEACVDYEESSDAMVTFTCPSSIQRDGRMNCC